MEILVGATMAMLVIRCAQDCPTRAYGIYESQASRDGEELTVSSRLVDC